MAAEGIQSFGRKLSAIVMPNIGAFIAWGLITAIFISNGWWPNEHIAKLVTPMLRYLLPLLIAYTAGRNVAGVRGGVAGAVATMGVIIGSDTPMFIGAMIMGPLAGLYIKYWDEMVKGRIKPGFEMLVDNFSLGIIAMLLAIAGYLLIGHAVSWLTEAISNGVNWMLAHKLNPLLAVLVDPAKVLFLNNAVNHGIMTPLGIEQASQMGHSMLFLVDPNPGPGLGILLACWVFGKGATRQSAPGAAIIQLFGGIHEIYFPYVLARPILLLAVMVGNICALSFYTLVDFGLVAPASPGSLISILLMSPKGTALTGLAGVAIGTLVSFLLAWPMIRRRPDFNGSDEQDSAGGNRRERSGRVFKIVFCCDAGMGSSALGATRFRKRVKDAGLNIDVCNSPVDNIPSDADIVVCQKVLADRTQKNIRKDADGKAAAELLVIENFLEDSGLDGLLKRLSGVLQPWNIRTGLPSESKEEAIRRAGKMLVDSGCVTLGYVNAMIEREKLQTTYMGMGIAIPHGTSEAKGKVLRSGVVVLQYPEGVDFGEEKARLVIGIAGAGDSHMDIISGIAAALEDEQTLETLQSCDDPELIYEILSKAI